MTNRAALYLRSSKDRSDVSIDAQRRALHDLAAQRALIVVTEYVDAVESGKDEDRPAWMRMLADLKAPGREWEHVLALDTSRVARRRLIAMMFESDCQKRGVRITYKSLPDSDPATEMVLRSVLQAFDEYHSWTSRAKGLAGMAENVRQGWRAGGAAPRGYTLRYHHTGAIRDGAAVTKTTLQLDEATAPTVQRYLRLRAQGESRGAAIAKTACPWPATSMHSLDWQALTYAGHTVWGMHAERQAGAAIGGEKRRPRSDWLIQRDTHPALITDAEAEAILAQQERSIQGRRMRASPLLLTGLLVTPDGRPWHSDGCGFYRLAKGKKFAAIRIETAVLARLAQDLSSDAAVARLVARMQQIAQGDPVDGRKLAGIERRIAALATQIGRTVDLAAQTDDPAPILRRVEALETQRAALIAELASLRQAESQRTEARTIDASQVRALLRRLFEEIEAAATGSETRAQARQALAAVIERIELDPAVPALRICYALAGAMPAGDNLASPRDRDLSPVRWEESIAIDWPRRRVAA